MNRLRALVVEDNELARDMIAKMFAMAGHEMVAHCTGLDDTLDTYRKLKPDLVTLDLSLGEGVDGLKVLKGILAADPKAKVVILSANIQKDARERLLEAGAKGFLTKPFTIKDFTALIEQVGGL